MLLAFSVVFGSLETLSFQRKSATWDESIHLVAGYAAISRGDFRVDPTHPPFSRMWSALPLLLMSIPLDTSPIDRTSPREWLTAGYAFAHDFLYKQNDADSLLYRARFMVVLWGIALGILIFFWASKWLGFVSGVLALVFYTIEPNIAAHSRLVTTDMAAALFMFGAIYWLWRVCRRPGVLGAVAFSVFFALALISKYSGVLLIPMLLLLLGIAVARRGIGLKWAGGIVILSAATAFLAIWAAYGFRFSPSDSQLWYLRTQELPGIQERIPVLAAIGKWIDDRHLLPNAYTEGFLLSQATSRLSAYLNGEIRPNGGWWYYFPFAFLVKTPVVLILLFISGIALFVYKRRPEGLMDWLFVLIPAAVYMVFAIASGINIGLRHILPIYPFVLLIAANTAGQLLNRRSAGRWIVAGLLAVWVAAFTMVYPNTLAFFNFAVGGPEQGLAYLADSNLDWGQDLKLLKSWMDSRSVSHINLAYFGTADPQYYGIDCSYLPGAPFFATQFIQKPVLPGYVAISATVLGGAYLTPQWRLFYSGFRSLEPVADLGHSIRVFWVEQWPEAMSDLSTDTEVNRWLADALLFNLQWAEHAVVHYRESLSNDTKDIPGVSNFATALVQANKGEEAIEVLQNALKNAPESGVLLNRMSYVYLSLRQFSEAENYAHAALRLNSDDAVAHDLLGVSLVGERKYAAAAESFQHAIRILPDYLEAQNHLAKLNEFLDGKSR